MAPRATSAHRVEWSTANSLAQRRLADEKYREFMAVVSELNGHGLTKIALVTEDL